VSGAPTSDERPQLSRADVQRLAKDDPAALTAAYQQGRVADVLAGKDQCPTCRRPMAER
jgi:hypothetical protein